MFSIDQNELNIKYKRILNNYIKCDKFYKRIKIDPID